MIISAPTLSHKTKKSLQMTCYFLIFRMDKELKIILYMVRLNKISDPLRDLVPFVQYEKREKHL